MPIAVAIALRYIIMAAVQLGIWWALEKYGIPLLNKAVEEIMIKFGVNEETAKDIMANKIILAFEEVGIFAITLKTKMPIKVAEYLGFTTKGYALRKIGGEVGLVAEKSVISATTKAVATTAEVEKVAEVVAKSSGWRIQGVSDLLKYVTLIVGTPVGFFYALAQYVDYGAWQNPYQKVFQKLLSYIGINPTTPLPNANTISAETWKRIYSTIEQLKPLGISFPVSGVDKPYNRENLAKVVDEIAANMVKVGTNPTYKNVTAALLLTLQFNGKEPPMPGTLENIIAGTGNSATGGSGGTSTPTVKVFTGIVSQGVVGKGLVFTPRPDDMIESSAEMREAAANNLAPFLQSLLGKIVYEVKVVSSIITKDGFKQTGTTQKIQTGTYQNGTPKYKTVTNKFATLVVYALTDKGSRAKLTTIVLGPVDSAKLTVGQNDLRELESKLPSLVTTTDIAEIKSIETKEVGKVVVNEEDKFEKTSIVVRSNDEIKYYQDLGYDIRRNPKDKSSALAFAPIGQTAPAYSTGAKAPDDPSYKFNTQTGKPNPNYKEPTPASVPATVNSVTPAAPTANTAGGNASTLYEWYQAQGLSMPSVSARAKLYADLGLGQASYYTGTSEQNTKLLNALKSGTNVSPLSDEGYKGYIDNGALGVR